MPNLLDQNFAFIAAKPSLGATTLSITTLSIMTLSIMTLSIMTLSIIVNKIRHSAYRHSAQGRALLCRLALMLNANNAECHLQDLLR